jgi:protein-tyrosine phosphatase
MTRILFVCHGNTCRSVIAAALARERFPDFEVASAGTDAWQATAQPWTIEVLETDYGIDATAHVPTPISTLDLGSYDVIVAMNDVIAEDLDHLPSEKVLVWDVDDPYDTCLEAYRETATTIGRELDSLTERLRAEGAIA